MSKIKNILAREVLDSRGRPTVEVDVILEGGHIGSGISPSGASKGSKEALELRDNDQNRYLGNGVLKAIQSVKEITPHLLGQNSLDHLMIDQMLIDLDGTENKSKYGANAILALSIANTRAAAAFENLHLFEFLSKKNNYILPMPMMNIINGGMHASNKIDIQEFMICPIAVESFSEAVRMGVEIFHHLKKILQEKNYDISVGDEGGFAPSNIESTTEALDLIMMAIEKANYRPGVDVVLALDVAASELYTDNKYHFKRINKIFEKEELIEFYTDLISRYPIFSIEDPMHELDFEGWRKITDSLGRKIQLVGDDVFVTNKVIFQEGINQNIANAILIKPNQIGTLKEAKETIELAKKNNYNTIMSHRSGETEDTTIADLSVAFETLQIKAGSLSRTDRVAKYNELIRIEEYSKVSCLYVGNQVIKRFNLKF